MTRAFNILIERLCGVKRFRHGPLSDARQPSAEVPIIQLIASRLIDRSDLLRQPASMGEDGIETAEPGAEVKMPATRDFR